MVTVDKYIRKLLFEHDCVIIPEFGGLLTHHVGAHYDAVNCVFLPARKRLAFNEVLKIDDGLLTYYVAAHEKLPREEALSVVRRYVDSLRHDLQGGGTVELDSIGVFAVNTEGKLVFEPDYSQNYNSEWFGMPSLTVQEIIPADVYTKEEVKILDSETVIDSSNEPAPRRHTWLNWAAAAVFIGAVTLLSTLDSASDSPSLLSTLNPFETVKDFKLESYRTAPKPKLLPVNQKAEEKSAPMEVVAFVPSNEPLEEAEPQTSVLMKSEAVETFPKEAPGATKKTATKVDKSTNRYFLIAGSFGRLKNAEDLKGQLIRKGFTESSVLDNSNGRLIKVSAGSYATMESALSHKKQVDAATGAESWVYHRK